MTERIVAAACIYNSLIFSLPPPARHGTLLKHFQAIRPEHSEIFPNQGFLTSTGRYVTREEALEIALAAQQISDSPHPKLYSEDLF